MREVTGYEDKHGRPILEGDIVRSHAGEIHAVGEIPEGWYPLCFFEEHEIASIEVVGSAYTEHGRRLLADAGIPAVEDEGELPWDYEETLDARHREAIEELSAMLNEAIGISPVRKTSPPPAPIAPTTSTPPLEQAQQSVPQPAVDRTISGSLVHQVRKHLHETQAQFAQRLGFSAGSVSHWERGKYQPPDKVKAFIHEHIPGRAGLEQNPL
jgi:DNA-binding XRE family transcriptional regulator